MPPFNLTFRDLSADDLEAIGVTGCGGKGLIDPPQFHFHSDCVRHDFRYWQGGDAADRRYADKCFLLDMQDSMDDPEIGTVQLLWRGVLAYVYFTAVRLFGSRYFHLGPKRGWAELEEARTAWKAYSRPSSSR